MRILFLINFFLIINKTKWNNKNNYRIKNNILNYWFETIKKNVTILYISNFIFVNDSEIPKIYNNGIYNILIQKL